MAEKNIMKKESSSGNAVTVLIAISILLAFVEIVINVFTEIIQL